jgi:hypothetical protein
MKPNSITFVVVLGLWTAFTLAGSVWAFLFMAGPNSITRLDIIRTDNTMVYLFAALTVFLCGGGLWGLGIARLMDTDAKLMVRACALSWSATVFTFVGAISFWGISLGSFSQLAYILPYFPHSPHYSFLLIFVPVIGIVTAINGYVVTGKLGSKELRKSAGLYAGIAAALGFLIVGLILLFGLGWGVGERPWKMLSLLELCNIGAALAGGMALGWALDKSRFGPDG